MDKVIMALMLAACGALTVAALRLGKPLPAAVAAAPAAKSGSVEFMAHGAAKSETAPIGSEVNAGAFQPAPDGSDEGHDMTAHTVPAPDDPPSTKALKDANATMHRDMNIQYTGDADRDFLHGMIPHHQGAIDMAKAVLAHGKDPMVRKLAESIVAAQEAEIKQMHKMLERTAPYGP